MQILHEGNDTGKIGNLVLIFSRQGRHRKVWWHKGNILTIYLCKKHFFYFLIWKKCLALPPTFHMYHFHLCVQSSLNVFLHCIYLGCEKSCAWNLISQVKYTMYFNCIYIHVSKICFKKKFKNFSRRCSAD